MILNFSGLLNYVVSFTIVSGNSSASHGTHFEKCSSRYMEAALHGVQLSSKVSSTAKFSRGISVIHCAVFYLYFSYVYDLLI